MIMTELKKIAKLLEKITEEMDWLSFPSQEVERKVKNTIHESINQVANICQDSVARETKKVSK